MAGDTVAVGRRRETDSSGREVVDREPHHAGVIAGLGHQVRVEVEVLAALVEVERRLLGDRAETARVDGEPGLLQEDEAVRLQLHPGLEATREGEVADLGKGSQRDRLRTDQRTGRDDEGVRRTVRAGRFDGRALGGVVDRLADRTCVVGGRVDGDRIRVEREVRHLRGRRGHSDRAVGHSAVVAFPRLAHLLAGVGARDHAVVPDGGARRDAQRRPGDVLPARPQPRHLDRRDRDVAAHRRVGRQVDLGDGRGGPAPARVLRRDRDLERRPRPHLGRSCQRRDDEVGTADGGIGRRRRLQGEERGGKAGCQRCGGGTTDHRSYLQTSGDRSSRSAEVTRQHEAGLVGSHDQLHPVAGTELREQARDV